MAKILVADDNSNVHKTVTLALADLGVEIVSVNNGDAAVRKLADFSPDLILADIFMPVRNGYEVCEFAKKDSRHSHVPVILLVGAFDPLDEREAQRVGADGILKKPFVPPDPLITMVKALLDRGAGERLVAVSVSKANVAARASSEASAVAEVHSPVQETSQESSNDEFPRQIERVEFGDEQPPVAFGQFLEPSAREATPESTNQVDLVDDEQVLTSARPATLGDPVFWQTNSAQGEPEAIEPQDVHSTPALGGSEKREQPPPSMDESELLKPIEPLELVREELDETIPSVVDSEPVLLDAAAQAPLTVQSDRAEGLAANPIEWMASAPSESPIDALIESSEPTPVSDVTIQEAADTIASHTFELAEMESPDISQDATPHPEPAVENFSPAVSVPVMTEPVASAAEAASLSPAPAPAIPISVTSVEPDSWLPKAEIQPASRSQSVTETARSIPRKNWESLVAPVESEAGESVTQQHKSEIAPTSDSPAVTLSPDAAMVEAVVQRVLDKMRPQVVEIITKEFLRPIVQALVQREIEKP